MLSREGKKTLSENRFELRKKLLVEGQEGSSYNRNRKLKKIPDVQLVKTLEPEEVRKLFKKDREFSKTKLVSNKSRRDVSYLRDFRNKDLRFTRQGFGVYPTEISHLRKLLACYEENYGSPIPLHNPLTCTKEQCADFCIAYKKRRNSGDMDEGTPEWLERQFLGYPTGRQDIKNLRNWFRYMKENFGRDSENMRIVFEICKKELIRQVSVQCFERGDLLAELWEVDDSINADRQSELRSELESAKNSLLAQISDLKKYIAKQKGDSEKQRKDFKERIQKKKKKVEYLKDYSNELYKKLNEMQKKYYEDQANWRAKELSFNTLSPLLSYNKEPEDQKVVTVSSQKKVKNIHSDQPSARSIQEDSILDEESKVQNIQAQESIQEAQETPQAAEETPDEVQETLEAVQQTPEAVQETINSVEIGVQVNSQGPEVAVKCLQTSFNEYNSEQEANEPEAVQDSEEAENTQGEDSQLQESAEKEPENLEAADQVLENPGKSPQNPEIVGEDLEHPDQSSQNPEVLDQASEEAQKDAKSSEKRALKGKNSQEKKLIKPKKFKPEKKHIELSSQKSSEVFIASKGLSGVSKGTEELSAQKKHKEIKELEATTESRKKDLEELEAAILNKSLQLQQIQAEMELSQQAKANEALEDEELDESLRSLIPKGAHIPSWKAGYNVGYEKGIAVGYKDGEQFGKEEGVMEGYLKAIKERSEENSELEEQESQYMQAHSFIEEDSAVELKSVLPKIGNRINRITKFHEFNFHRKDPSAHKKSSPALGLLQNFLRKKLETIKKKSTMSRKMVNRIVANLYHSLFDTELNQTLVEYIYDDFINKYGLKKVAEKKYLEFIASVIRHSEYRRSRMFVKFIGIAKKINLENYTKMGFEFYLPCLQFMMNSKIGIVINYDDTEDKQMFPVSRAIECTRETLHFLYEKQQLQEIVNKIERSATEDPKKINRGGLVELEFVLEVLCEAFESHRENIENGVGVLLDAIGNQEDSITKAELEVLIRQVSPERLMMLKEDQEDSNSSRVRSARVNSDILEKQEFSLEELMNKCIYKNFLGLKDVKNFYDPESQNLEEDILSMAQKRPVLQTIIDQINQVPDNIKKTIPALEWQTKLDFLLENANISEGKYKVLGWKIFEKELEWIQKEYLADTQ